MQFFNSYFQKLLSILRIRSTAGGLEVSDQVLRLVYDERGKWKTEAVRLAPGVLQKGKIVDAAAFDAALKELRSRVPSGQKKGKKMNVIVSLSSVNMYSQVFTLPLMAEGDDLDKAIGLNVQMVSPADINNMYYGWQLLGHDETGLRLEVVAAFAEKNIVDEVVQALYAAGFVTVGVESRALALARYLREKTTEMEGGKSYLLLDIDNSGIDFLIIRKGHLYFEYANQWADIADEKGQVAVKKFKDVLAASLRQVVNFYGQRWPDPLAGVVISAAAFGDEAAAAVADSIALPVIPLVTPAGTQVPPEWFVAFGCALRGMNANLKDREINLSGDGALDTFHEERLVNFMNLWRFLIPAVLALLVLVLVLADSFLNTIRSGIEAQPAFTQQGAEAAQVEALTASSTVFNQLVALAANAEGQISGNYLLIADINTLASANGISINQISFQSAGAPILVSGLAQTTDDIASFKTAIQRDPHFGTVTLPLLNIQQNTGGSGYTFSMSFPLGSSF
jgi:hypothetical protein